MTAMRKARSAGAMPVVGTEDELDGGEGEGGMFCSSCSCSSPPSSPARRCSFPVVAVHRQSWDDFPGAAELGCKPCNPCAPYEGCGHKSRCTVVRGARTRRRNSSSSHGCDDDFCVRNPRHDPRRAHASCRYRGCGGGGCGGYCGYHAYSPSLSHNAPHHHHHHHHHPHHYYHCHNHQQQHHRYHRHEQHRDQYFLNVAGDCHGCHSSGSVSPTSDSSSHDTDIKNASLTAELDCEKAATLIQATIRGRQGRKRAEGKARFREELYVSTFLELFLDEFVGFEIGSVALECLNEKETEEEKAVAAATREMAHDYLNCVLIRSCRDAVTCAIREEVHAYMDSVYRMRRQNPLLAVIEDVITEETMALARGAAAEVVKEECGDYLDRKRLLPLVDEIIREFTSREMKKLCKKVIQAANMGAVTAALLREVADEESKSLLFGEILEHFMARDLVDEVVRLFARDCFLDEWQPALESCAEELLVEALSPEVRLLSEQSMAEAEREQLRDGGGTPAAQEPASSEESKGSASKVAAKVPGSLVGPL